MKIVFVLGGSYKSFYLNYFLKLTSCDLLVFNFGVLYDVDVEAERAGKGVVFSELKNLSDKLGCEIVAGVSVKSGDATKFKILHYKNGEIKLFNSRFGCKFNKKNKKIVVADDGNNLTADVKIVLSKKRIVPTPTHCSNKKIYAFCDEFGINLIVKKKLTRRFYKYTAVDIK